MPGVWSVSLTGTVQLDMLECVCLFHRKAPIRFQESIDIHFRTVGFGRFELEDFAGGRDLPCRRLRKWVAPDLQSISWG